MNARLLSILLVLITAACVDRIFTNITAGEVFDVVVDGFISDQPGPYTIHVTKAFDIESKNSPKETVSANRVTISDNSGNNEVLTEVTKGVYQTSPTGIRGIPGKVYKLTVELKDGRTYESVPDTLNASGKLDSIYSEFVTNQSTEGAVQYGFDIFFNSTASAAANYQYVWKFTGTFRSDTNPELKCARGPMYDDCEPCGTRACAGCSLCNYVPICSGIQNMSNFPDFGHWRPVQVTPCTCCTCWYDMFNDAPILSESSLLRSGKFNGVKVMFVPLNAWIFQHKIRILVEQMAVSRQTYRYYQSIRAQREAIGSLFQPVTGKITGNFIQTGGTPLALQGHFFQLRFHQKTRYLSYDDVVNKSVIPEAPIPWRESCLKLFPNATNVKPAFWVE